MGRKLTDTERAHRIVNKIEFRKLQGRGKCALCKEPIPAGQPSLRYHAVTFGRSAETGICVNCVENLWPLVEDHFKRVAGQIESFINDRRGPPVSDDEHTPPETDEDIEQYRLRLVHDIFQPRPPNASPPNG
jgi:hypothetical protein